MCRHQFVFIYYAKSHDSGVTAQGLAPLDDISLHLHKVMKAGDGEDKTIYQLTWEEVICEHRLVQVWSKGKTENKAERGKGREAERRKRSIRSGLATSL